MKCTSQKSGRQTCGGTLAGGGQPGLPPSGVKMAVSTSDGRSESGGDSGDPGSQRRPDLTTSSTTEHSTHCANDTNRDDNVLERHHAVLVRAQVLQSFGGFNVIFQHI